MSPVISVENLSKAYRLGQIGTGTLSHDLNVWWAKVRGKPNPLLKIGQIDHGNREGNEIWALKDVSFAIEQGEVLGIIGRNGAGKSTLLKILSRVTAPTSGKVKIRGRIASLLEVGTGFHPDLTGRENIYLNGAILGMRRNEIERKFEEIVAFSEVEKFIDTPVKRYSSGMYVRLAFAVAAHLEPEILVVDEVLAVGDAAFQNKCLGKMGDIAKEGRTVLFVSHNLGAINRITKTCIWLHEGKTKNIGNTAMIINSYLESSRELSIANYEKGSSHSPIRLLSAEINKNNKATEEISFGESFVVKVKFLVLEQVIGATFLIALIAADGTRLATMNSSDRSLQILLSQGKQGEVSWECQHNMLIPGQYFLIFEVHNNLRAPIAQYESFLQFRVMTIGAPERLARNASRAGYITLSNSWSYKEIV